MPEIKVEAGPMTKDQKTRLIEELTATASNVLGVRKEAFYVLIKENSNDNWGVGGRMLSEVFKERESHK